MIQETSLLSIKEIVGTLIWTGAHKATKYFSDKQIVRATRKVFGGRINKRDRSIEIILTIGHPNYAERKFIKQCKMANVKFPIKKIQLKYFPKKKK